jgi:predicted ATPase/DNA-binding CsgD family transcriptional regulator
VELRRKPGGKRVGNVPHAVEHFVGRVDKLAELDQKVSVARLVTITSVGGGGKTRLALEFAAQVQESGVFEDGVWIAELDSVNDEDMLYQAVLTALDAPGQSTRTPLPTLLEYLQDKSMLLVLDNCEHLGRTVGKLAITLLRATKNLRIVATSRTQLGAAGEAVVSVHPMTVPPEHALIPAAPYREYEAVQLFSRLVEASVPGWELTEDNWPDVVQILRGVDGIPLAIKLVAVRLRTMSIKDLVARMGDLFTLLNKNDLAADQHETLEAVFRWNLTNCTEDEKILWARASVFAGTFTLDAAEKVCSDADLPRSQVADALRGLIESSTVETNTARTRFRLLVPLRQFGATLLAERGEQDTLLRKRNDHFLDVAALAASKWYGEDEYHVLNELAADLPNFAAVMHSYIAAPDPGQTGLQLAVNLARTRLYFYLGRMRESISWLNRTLDATLNPNAELKIAALSLDLFVDLCIGADLDRVQPRLEQLKQLAEAVGQPSPVVWFADGLKRVLLHNDCSGLPLLDQAYTALRAAGPDTHGDASMPLLLKGIGEVLIGDKHHAQASASRVLLDNEIAGSPWMIRWAQWCVGVVLVRFGQPVDAATHLENLLRAQTNVNEADNWLPMWIIEVMAWTAARMRAGQRTAVLLGISSALTKITGTRINKILPFVEHHLKAEETAKQLLGEANYRSAFAYGGQIRNISDARRVALGEPVERLDIEVVTDQFDDAGTWDLLTPTQQDVAVLVTRGLTNRQIADLRRSSVRTIETHITEIRQRVGIPSGRSSILAWAHRNVPPQLLNADGPGVETVQPPTR